MMDVDDTCLPTTPVNHQCTLDTITAVCTQESVVRHVVPYLVEHAKSLCEG